MTITIITVGSKPNREIASLINDYTKRLPAHVQIVWRYIKHAPGNRTKSIAEESENILSAIPKNNVVVLCDETGVSISSEQFSKRLFSTGRDTTFIIGGAYGVSAEVKTRASSTIAFGNMVFPHQLVRLMLTEQIYRAYCIHTDHPYHHS